MTILLEQLRARIADNRRSRLFGDARQLAETKKVYASAFRGNAGYHAQLREAKGGRPVWQSSYQVYDRSRAMELAAKMAKEKGWKLFEFNFSARHFAARFSVGQKAKTRYRITGTNIGAGLEVTIKQASPQRGSETRYEVTDGKESAWVSEPDLEGGGSYTEPAARWSNGKKLASGGVQVGGLTRAMQDDSLAPAEIEVKQQPDGSFWAGLYSTEGKLLYQSRGPDRESLVRLCRSWSDQNDYSFRSRRHFLAPSAGIAPTILPGGNYTAVDNGNGTHTIKDVPIMGMVEQGERGNRRPVDPEWLREAMARTQLRMRHDKYVPPLHVFHHKDDGNRSISAGFFIPKRVGQINYEGQPSWFLFADLVVRDRMMPLVEQMELPYRSVEVLSWEKAEIGSLALMSDEPPHFKVAMLSIGKKLKAEPRHFSSGTTGWVYDCCCGDSGLCCTRGMKFKVRRFAANRMFGDRQFAGKQRLIVKQEKVPGMEGYEGYEKPWFCIYEENSGKRVGNPRPDKAGLFEELRKLMATGKYSGTNTIKNNYQANPIGGSSVKLYHLTGKKDGKTFFYCGKLGWLEDSNKRVFFGDKDSADEQKKDEKDMADIEAKPEAEDAPPADKKMQDGDLSSQILAKLDQLIDMLKPPPEGGSEPSTPPADVGLAASFEDNAQARMDSVAVTQLQARIDAIEKTNKDAERQKLAAASAKSLADRLRKEGWPVDAADEAKFFSAANKGADHLKVIEETWRERVPKEPGSDDPADADRQLSGKPPKDSVMVSKVAAKFGGVAKAVERARHFSAMFKQFGGRLRATEEEFVTDQVEAEGLVRV